MARRKRSKSGELVIMIIFAALLYLVLQDRVAMGVWVLLGIAVLGSWWFFAMPTKCDVLTNRDRPCRQDVRGKVNGCRWHAREKRDAIFAMFNLRNPGQLFRAAWSARQPTVARHPATGEKLRISRSTAYEAIMLGCTVVSTVAGVAGAAFGAAGLL